MARRIVDQFADDTSTTEEASDMGQVVQLNPAARAALTALAEPPADFAKRSVRGQDSLKRRGRGRLRDAGVDEAAWPTWLQLAAPTRKPKRRPTRRARAPGGAAPTPAAEAPAPAGAYAAPAVAPTPPSPLLEHIFVAVLCAGIGALMIKVAYGSFATIEGTAAYLASAEQAANLAWSIVGSEALLGLFLGLCHKVVRFRRLGKALVVMLLLCAVVEACMAWVRTEASVHQAVERALTPAREGGLKKPPSGPSVSVSTEGRSRGAIKDMTGLTTAAASLAQTQATAEARKDAREDRRAAQRIASAKDRSRLAQVIPVGAAVVQAGATELGGLAVAELVWSLLAIAASIAAAVRGAIR